MGPHEEFPAEIVHAKVRKEDFNSVCCHKDGGPSGCLIGSKGSESIDLIQGKGLQRIYNDNGEKDNVAKRSKVIEFKKDDNSRCKKPSRQSENKRQGTLKTVFKADDFAAGGSSDGSKNISGKAVKRKTKTSLESLDSEVQTSFQKENEISSNPPFMNNHQKGDEVKKIGGNKVHLQRRILANARERSRVHKLGEAFRMLRNVIPSFSADQKLSKLSTLRIAVSYISALGSLLVVDSKPSAKQVFTSSVDQCTFALQSEFGRAKGTRKIKSKINKLTKCKRAKNNK